MRRIISPVLVFVCAAASSATAQSRESAVILDGSAFVGIERVAHVEYEAPVASNDLSATVAGGSLAIGTFLSRNVSVRLEVARPGGSHVTYPSPALFGVSPLDITATYSSDYQSWATTVLAGYHNEPRGRLRLAYLGGVAFVREQTHLVSVISIPGLLLVPPRTSRTETTAFSTRPAVAVGMDAEIAAARHLAVVPQLRVIAFGGRLGVRPGVALRWKS